MKLLYLCVTLYKGLPIRRYTPNTAESSRCQNIPWCNFVTEYGIFGVTFSIWEKEKLCHTGFVSTEGAQVLVYIR